MAGDVLRDLFKKIVPEETRRSSEVFHGWENIVGAETALHVEPVDIRNHSLLLESDHPGWSQKNSHASGWNPQEYQKQIPRA